MNKLFLEGPVLDNGNKVRKWEDLTSEQKLMPIQTKLTFSQLVRTQSQIPKVIFRGNRDVFNVPLTEVESHLESKIRDISSPVSNGDSTQVLAEDSIQAPAEVSTPARAEVSTQTPTDDSTQASAEAETNETGPENPADIEYVIEDMVGFVKAGGQLRIICKWKDYDESENTNETFENLANSMYMVKKFVREQLKKKAYCVQVVDSANYRWEEKFLDQNLQFIKPLRIVCFDASNDWVVVEWKNTPDLTYHTRQEAEKFFLPLLIQFFKRNMDSFNRGIIRDRNLPQTLGEGNFYENYKGFRRPI